MCVEDAQRLGQIIDGQPDPEYGGDDERDDCV
jgi:hypothetical protein